MDTRDRTSSEGAWAQCLAKVIPQATAAELCKSAWLQPHFVSEDDTTQHPCAAGRGAGAELMPRDPRPFKVVARK